MCMKWLLIICWELDDKDEIVQDRPWRTNQSCNSKKSQERGVRVRWRELKANHVKTRCTGFRIKLSWTQILASVQFSSVQSFSSVWLSATPWITAHQASLSITNSWSSLRLTSIEPVMPSSHLILCRPLLLLPPIPPSITKPGHISHLVLMTWFHIEGHSLWMPLITEVSLIHTKITRDYEF